MEKAGRSDSDAPASPEEIYQYEPLIAQDAVRVLTLEPAGAFQSPLRGSITQHRLTFESVDPDGCKYSAVSYSWGDPTLSHQLWIRLGARWTSLSITKNADLLLRYLRDTLKEISLWIDGVCINQSDEGDKTRQIPLMGQIYAHANRVHIWLGCEEIEDAQKAFSLIRRLELGLEPIDTLEQGSENFLCLERLFKRRWFSRRWVVQEVFFAHDPVFHCGHHTLSLSRMMAALNAKKYRDINWPSWGLRMLRSSVRSDMTNKKGLLTLLWDLDESECSDTRDNIAAIYALSDDAKRPPLHYNIGSWQEMYTEMAANYCKITKIEDELLGRRRYIRYEETATKDEFSDTAHGILHHLCSFGSIESSKGGEVPSWIPNWSTQRQHKMFLNWTCKTDMSEPPRPRSPSNIRVRQTPSQEARYWYESWLEKRGEPSPQRINVRKRKLQLGYDFLTFVYGCGMLDQVVHPARSEDFWDEVTRLVRWQKEVPDVNKDRLERAVYRADQYHQMEVDSLSALLTSILDGVHTNTGYSWESSVEALCGSLYRNHGDEKSSHGLGINSQEIILRSIRSACKDMALLRVQSTVGYYWMIGPLSLIQGDWLTPIIPPGRSRSQKSEPLVEYMSLRPIVQGKPGNSWFPYPGSDPETRLRLLESIGAAEIDPVHIHAKFVGSGRGCSLAIDKKFSSGLLMWKAFRETTEKADRRYLPGPIIFDIV